MNLPSKPVEDVTDTDVVQLVVHGAAFPGIVTWLQRQGFEVSPFPRPEGELDTYMVVPGRPLLERFWPTGDQRNVGEREL